MGRFVWIAVLAAGCGRIAFDPLPLDGAPADEAPLGAWSAPVPVPIASGAGPEEDCTGSATKLELIFRLGATTTRDLYLSTRATPADPWGPGVPLTSINSASGEGGPRLSPDDLTLYFESDRTGSLGFDDVWTTTRPAVGAAWGPVTNVAYINTTSIDKWLTTCEGDRYVVVRATGFVDTLYQGVVGSPPVAISELNTGSESSPHLMPDCLTLYFNSDRNGTSDIFYSTRPTIDSSWAIPVLMPDVNLPGTGEQDAWMSPDQRLFIFVTDRSGTVDVWSMTR